MSKSKFDERPITWTRNRRGKVPRYKYSTLKEIYNHESIDRSSFYYVYGVVCDFKEAAKSKGSDYFALVFIVDDTSQVPLKIRLFHRDLNFFPKVDIGDILRLHRLKVYKYDEVILNSVKGWSWVHWRHKDDIFTSEKASSESYTLSASDRDYVDKLRQWYEQHSSTISGKNEKYKRIQEIEHDDHFSLICQILGFKEVSSTHIIAKVWDGTQPNVEFHHFADFEDFISEDIPDNYIVDISVYDEHVSNWLEYGIDKGDYVKFCNLHAWPNPQNEANIKTKSCSELSIHPGKAYGRGVDFANDDEYLNIVKSDIDTVKSFADLGNTFTQSQQEETNNCPGPSTGPPQQNNINEEQDLENEIVNVDGDASDEETLKQCDLIIAENKVSQSWLLSSYISNEKDSQSTDNSHVIRCLQESLTVVSGEGMPLKISELKDVIKHDVPMNTSKYFRVRADVKSCKASNGTLVIHCCPITGIAFPTTNSGKPLNFTGDVRLFVEAWRKVRGLDSQINDESFRGVNMDSQAFSQWDLPSSQGSNPIAMRKYECKKDGSKWESMETETYVIRKRKQDGKPTFKILYLLKVEDYSVDGLIKQSSKYDRVIRNVPLSMQLSTNPPAVGIQHGVFYYSCPAFAVPPHLPSLEEDAENFIENRLSCAMNSPTLVPRFSLVLSLADGNSRLQNVTLSGKRAVEFFCDTTPQDYLLNRNEVANSIKECIDKIVDGSALLECIIEKKCRKRINAEDQRPYYLYDICNTSLKG